MATLVMRVIRVAAASVFGALVGVFCAAEIVFRLIHLQIDLGPHPAKLVAVAPVVIGFLIGGWLEFKRTGRSGTPQSVSSQ